MIVFAHYQFLFIHIGRTSQSPSRYATRSIFERDPSPTKAICVSSNTAETVEEKNPQKVEQKAEQKETIREARMRATTSLSGPSTQSTQSSYKRRQSTGTDRSSYKQNKWEEVDAPAQSSVPLSPNRLKSEGKESIRKFNRESGGFAIGTPLYQPTLEFTPKFPEPAVPLDAPSEAPRPKTAPESNRDPNVNLKYADLKYGRGIFSSSVGRSASNGNGLNVGGSIRRGTAQMQSRMIRLYIIIWFNDSDGMHFFELIGLGLPPSVQEASVPLLSKIGSETTQLARIR